MLAAGLEVAAVVAAAALLVSAVVFSLTYESRSRGRWRRSDVGRNQVGSAVSAVLVAIAVKALVAGEAILGHVLLIGGLGHWAASLWIRARIVTRVNRPVDAIRVPEDDDDNEEAGR